MEEKPQRNKKTAKCGHCSGSIPQGEGLKHNSRYYHEDCYEEATKESRHYKELIDYICQLYNIRQPTGMILMQIKRFKEELGYTYKGIELSLRYFYDILENSVREGNGIGIVPYVYEDTKNNYIMKLKVQQSVTDFNENVKTKVVRIQKPNNNNFKGNKDIDIESL